jgi:HemY protein
MSLKQNPKSPSYPYVVKLMAEVYVQLQDWENLHALLPELGKHKILPEHRLQELTLACYRGLLRNVTRQPESIRLETLRTIWRDIPRKLHANASLLLCYCEKLNELGVPSDAESAIADFLKQHWDEALVRLYGQIHTDHPQKQLQNAESWLSRYPNQAILLLTLGRLCLLNKQWDQARNHFEASLRSRKTPEAYAELGRLLRHTNEHQLSSEYLQKGLELTTERLPELPLPTGGGS